MKYVIVSHALNAVCYQDFKLIYGSAGYVPALTFDFVEAGIHQMRLNNQGLTVELARVDHEGNFRIGSKTYPTKPTKP